MKISRKAIITTVSAAPKGQLSEAWNCCWIRLPTITSSGPPSSEADTKSPTAGRNTSTEPASTPCTVCGRVTWRKVCHGLP